MMVCVVNKCVMHLRELVHVGDAYAVAAIPHARQFLCKNAREKNAWRPTAD